MVVPGSSDRRVARMFYEALMKELGEKVEEENINPEEEK